MGPSGLPGQRGFQVFLHIKLVMGQKNQNEFVLDEIVFPVIFLHIPCVKKITLPLIYSFTLLRSRFFKGIDNVT